MCALLTHRTFVHLDRIPCGRKHQPKLDRFALSSLCALKGPLPSDHLVQILYDQLHRNKPCDLWPDVQCPLSKEHLLCDQGRVMLALVHAMLEQVHVRINPDSDRVLQVSDREQREAGETGKRCVSEEKSTRTEGFQIEAIMSG